MCYCKGVKDAHYYCIVACAPLIHLRDLPGGPAGLGLQRRVRVLRVRAVFHPGRGRVRERVLLLLRPSNRGKNVQVR